MAKIDFRNLGLTTVQPTRTITDPRDLFSALPDKDPVLDYLRGPQDQVLAAWESRRAERDVVIKMNTGGGKTVVGLLIARCLLNEGEGPAVYLVPDDFLVAQVQAQASQLGIDYASAPEEASFQQCRAVLICTFAKLFNGLSAFGVEGSVAKTPKFSLNALVIDDAHACVVRADQAFRLRIDRDADAYDKLLQLFRDDLYGQSPNALMDLEDRRYSALLEVPFWAWQDKQDQVMQVLHPMSTQDNLKFQWPLVVDCLPLCTAVFTRDAVEIQAPIHPTDLLTGFHEAKRRVYLTATLADDSVLVRHFGADPKSVANPIFPASAGDIGDRMILVPQNLCPTAKDEDVRAYVAQLAENRNVVVIVPSRRRAQWWDSVSKLTLNKDNIHQGVEELRANPSLGLVVMVNRYDGIDLPGDACRVVVIDGLPEAWDGMERLEEGQLRGSAGMLARQVQRLEQGMGRATRSNEDDCVVLLMGTRLVERLNNPAAAGLFSPATRAQLGLASQVAENVKATGLKDLTDVINQCLERDRGWVGVSRGVLATVRYDAPSIGPEAESERRAFKAACRGDITEAESQQKVAIEALKGEDENRRALLTQRCASYVHSVDKARAQTLQKRANERNRRLIRPLAGIQYDRLTKAAQPQGQQGSAWLSHRYASGNELVVGFNALIQDLAWSPARTRQFEQAVADLGWHLGLMAQRPDEDFGQGPDDLWALDGGDFLVIEAKSGADPGHPVKKDDAKQLSNSMDWFHERYPNSSATPVLVHPEARFGPAAAIPQGCRVIDAEHLSKLCTTLENLARQLGTDDAYRDHARVTKALADTCLRVTVAVEPNTFLHRFTQKGYKKG